MQPVQRRTKALGAAGAAGLLLAGLGGSLAAQGSQPEKRIDFTMVRSAAAANAGCVPDARASVEIQSKGPVEKMRVRVKGLPKNTNFDFFVIQVPNAPFGLSWYQGDIETNGHGTGTGSFVGRFNVETFIVAPGSAPAPKVHDADATTNPATPPVHTFHLGLWFNSPADAAAAGCPSTVTPFNGDHTAGIQVLSTRNFDDDQGPLRQLAP
ncbi:MAG: hypothetical protein QOH43_879 [Solirubrobacteraceae bacterium]|jgi:hypothetical protein|nr:hypothetical protein [Solirubrobacteraceae bacterium]